MDDTKSIIDFPQYEGSSTDEELLALIIYVIVGFLTLYYGFIYLLNALNI